MIAIDIKLSKQAQKYLASVDKPTRKKLLHSLDKVSRFEGNIVRLSGHKNLFHYKIEQYRIIFRWNQGEIIIYVIEINSRTNIHYIRY